MIKEVWKPIAGYEGLYEISNLGKIKSLRNERKRKTKILKNFSKTSKYIAIELSKHGKTKTFSIHLLLAKYFDHSIPDIEFEIWKDIKDYEGLYQVSNFGRIKSLARKTGFIQRREKIVKPWESCIRLSKNKKTKSFLLCKVITSAFIPNPDNSEQINYKDDNFSNNKLENLEWVPPTLKLESEIWKTIGGYEGFYEISSLGRVKSLHRKERILSPYPTTNGYPFLHLCKNKINKCFMVHRLVAKAFAPNPENKPNVNHINGIKADNRAENLEWTTQAENIKHALETGLIKPLVGEKAPNSKVTESQVKEIRELYSTGKFTYLELASKFGMKSSGIRAIVHRETWKHI